MIRPAAALTATLLLAAAAFAPHALTASQETTPATLYTTKVQPILATNCYKCHGGMNHRGGLSVDSKGGLLKGGHSGPAVVPGDPANSLLVKLIRHEGPADDPRPMPPRGKLNDLEIATIEEWIKAGAVMPDDPK